MAKWAKIIIAVNIILVLVFFNRSLIKKEQLLKEGNLILLELAPVDPRSLIQGDYMDLRYAIATNVNTDSMSKNGFCLLELDSLKVARLKKWHNTQPKTTEKELIIKYHLNGYRVKLGAESYFFQEGRDTVFQNAKYGGLVADEDGNTVLTGLYNEKRELLK